MEKALRLFPMEKVPGNQAEKGSAYRAELSVTQACTNIQREENQI